MKLNAFVLFFADRIMFRMGPVWLVRQRGGTDYFTGNSAIF
jgi:hypothetical protein